jgi:hypothetical protein
MELLTMALHLALLCIVVTAVVSAAVWVILCYAEWRERKG